MINELETLIKQLSITIRYEKGDFEGGYCILKDQKVLVVNKKLTDMRKASILACALAEFGIEKQFLKPVIREFIEDEVAKIGKAK